MQTDNDRESAIIAGRLFPFDPRLYKRAAVYLSTIGIGFTAAALADCPASAIGAIITMLGVFAYFRLLKEDGVSDGHE